MSTWKDVDLCGAAAIARVCGVYEITDPRVPGTRFKIKVLDRPGYGFLAVPNMSVRGPDGTPEGITGLGATEEEALADCLKWVMSSLEDRARLMDADVEWSDPQDF